METIRYGEDTTRLFDYITVSDTQLDKTPFRIAIHRLEGTLCAYVTREQLIELRAAIADVLLAEETENTKKDNEEITL